MSLPYTGWAREPILWLDQDFDHDDNDANNLTTTVAPLWFGNAQVDHSWVCAAVTGAASVVQELDGQFGHVGVWDFQTGAVSGRGYAVAMTLGSLSLTATAVLASAVHRWDWWVQTGTVASTNLYVGLSDDWTSIGVPTTCSILGLHQASSATLFTARTRSTTLNQSTVSTVAVPASDWVKLSGVQTDSAWIYLVNDVVVATHLSGIASFSGAPVSPGVSVFTATAAARTIQVDRCRVWTDGSNMVG